VFSIMNIVMIKISLRDRKRAQLHNEILEAASSAFAREGYEHLSMRKLAAQLGCSPGTLYLYFSDKDELLRAVVEESFAGLLKTLRSIPTNDDVLGSLKAKLRAYIDFGVRNPHHYKCAFVLQPAGVGRPQHTPHPAFQEMVDAVRNCVDKGVLGTAEIKVTSQVLWACIHGITSLLISRPSFPWVEQNQLVTELIESAVAGVARPRRSEKKRKSQ
jgi:AcrR family transcriptional regulator